MMYFTAEHMLTHSITNYSFAAAAILRSNRILVARALAKAFLTAYLRFRVTCTRHMHSDQETLLKFSNTV